MRKLFIVTTILAVMAGTAGAGDLSVYGSYWSTDELDDTWGAGARVRIGPGTPAWLEVRGTYFDDVTEDRPLFDVELETIPVDAGIGLSLLDEGDANLYLVGGGTYFLLDTNRGEVDDEVGWYAGVGGDVALSEHLSLFAELLFRDVEATVEDDDLDRIEDPADIDLAGSVVNVGLVFR